ncbi:MAG: 2OG-Fe(II) oxygenase [Bacteroidota bacterium]
MTPFTYNLPTLQNFSQYVFIENSIIFTEIAQINQYWDEQQKQAAELEGGVATTDEELRKTSIVGLENNEEHQWLYQRISNFALQVNNQRYFYDIRGIFEPLQLMEYSEGDFFDWHLDFGNQHSSIRKLSVTMQLSDPTDYEGGDLQFMINKDIITAPRSKGTIIIFPSFIMHRVTPITQGKRRSIVGWVSGPPFR